MKPLIENFVSPETLQKFKIYEQLLREWNRRTALVQEDTLSDFNTRHILDSLQLIPIIESIESQSSVVSQPPNQDTSPLSNLEPSRNYWEKLDLQSQIKDALSIIDMGTGAGFPGIVLAMCGFRRVRLCESNQKKCFFLEEVARQTNTDVAIINDRVENVKEKVDIILSRACTDLDGLLEMMSPLLSDASSYSLFHKGRCWQEEVASARKKWQFSGSFCKSVTSKDGVILYIHHLERREAERKPQ